MITTDETPTRRATMPMGVAMPIVLATPFKPEPPISPSEAMRLRRFDFIEQIAWLHSNGRHVASKAMAMGVDLDAFSGVQLHSQDHPEMMPVLHFGKLAVYA